jgi:hypothetical protein
MYEMEGPRLAVVALACRLPGCRAPRGCHRPHASAAISGHPDLSASRGFPQVQHVFSGESSSTANSARHTRPLPGPLQDSLVVHRTSAVYPLCSAAFHRPIHKIIHSLGTTSRQSARPEGPGGQSQRGPAADAEETQKRAGDAEGRADRRAAPEEGTQWAPTASQYGRPSPRESAVRGGCGPSRSPLVPPVSWPAGALPWVSRPPRTPNHRRPPRTAGRAARPGRPAALGPAPAGQAQVPARRAPARRVPARQVPAACNPLRRRPRARDLAR